MKAGAFDPLEPHRAKLLAGVELILAASNRAAEASAAGQEDLFGGGGPSADELRLPEAEPWLPMDKLGHEFEAVGFYVSGHPLDDYMAALPRLGAETWASFRDKALKGATAAKLVGTVTHRRAPLGEERQQVRLCRFFRSDRAVRDDLLLRHSRRPATCSSPARR